MTLDIILCQYRSVSSSLCSLWETLTALIDTSLSDFLLLRAKIS